MKEIEYMKVRSSYNLLFVKTTIVIFLYLISRLFLFDSLFSIRCQDSEAWMTSF